MNNKKLWFLGLLVSVIIAGVVSFYASSHPDGLEKAADEVGFLDDAQDSAVADSPLADYGVSGIEDERLSVGLAGVLGVLVMVVVAGGGFMLLTRKPQRQS
jgi:cobalt/nickel transport protein